MAGAFRQLDYGARRVAILKGALHVIKAKGLRGTTMADIAKRLSMTKGNLYYYFPGKEWILYACHDYSLDLLLDGLIGATEAPVATDEKLRMVLMRQMEVLI